MTANPQPPVRMRTLLASLLALSAAQLGRSTEVHASCVGPELDLLWTYPEAGAEQVPTNVTIWAVTSVWSSSPAATLDGQPLDIQAVPSFSGVSMQPQQLTPNSEHVLVLDYTHSPNLPTRDKPRRFEIKFTTGAGPAEGSITEPDVTGTTRVLTDFASHACAAVIAAQDCFDTGQDTLLSLKLHETQSEATVGWLVQSPYLGSSAVWPARCGAPSLYIHRQQHLCMQVQRIGAGGRLSEPVQHCSDPTTDVPPMDADGGAPADTDSGAPDNEPDTGTGGSTTKPDARAPSDEVPLAGCSTVSGARTAARAFWAIVVIALLLAHSRRRRPRRPRGVIPSRRFRI